METLAIAPDDLVFEIGPGRGAITSLLAARARRLIAIEVDRALVEALRQDFRDNPKVEIVSADVLAVDFAGLCRKGGTSNAFVFGNLPYYITSPILHHLFTHRASIRAMGLLMQREVAQRLIAAPGTREYGYLSVATQVYSQPEIAFGVPPGAFSPAPKVQSALVTFQMQAKFKDWPAARHAKFLKFVKQCFAQKRKNLLNNLGGKFSRNQVIEALKNHGQPGNSRAEELSLDGLAAVFDFLWGSD